MATIEDLTEEKEFDLELVGNFGRFVSSGSYPIEFFMTSLSITNNFDLSFNYKIPNLMQKHTDSLSTEIRSHFT